MFHIKEELITKEDVKELVEHIGLRMNQSIQLNVKTFLNNLLNKKLKSQDDDNI